MKTIVVADGKKHFLDKACTILEQEGYDVVAAENGHEAMQKASEKKAALILADYLMPEKSGLGLVFEMRQRGDQTPVVIMAESPLVTMENVTKSGANGLLKKPLDEKHLVTTVKKILAS